MSGGSVSKSYTGTLSQLPSHILRSPFGETSEAIYLTQGYTYESAESAEARFANREPGYVYSRFANPTVAMFEERMRLMEGADIYQVAKNCRTSVEMIEKYYASHIKNVLDASAINVRKAKPAKGRAGTAQAAKVD